MCCTKKWVGGLAALVVLVAGLGVVSQTKFGKDWGGWTWVQFEKMVGWADDQRTLDDEIKRLENEVKDLDKSKAKLKDRSYTLKDEIKETKAGVEKQRTALRELRDLMNQRKAALEEARKSGNDFVTVEGVTSKVEVIRKNLAENTDRFEKGYADLQRKEQLLAKMESNLGKINDNVGGLEQTQKELLAELGEMKAKLEEVRLDEAQKANGQADDELNQKLTYIRGGVKDIRSKINVMAERSKENVAEVTREDGFNLKVAGDKAEVKLDDINKIDLGGNK